MFEVKCFAQDPTHTEMDAQILLEHGITVVDDPRVFLKVDESSAVIALAQDIPVKEIIADIARPALIIWDKVYKPGTQDV